MLGILSASSLSGLPSKENSYSATAVEKIPYLGTFYMTLLLQQGSLGFFYVLLRITDMINFFFSPSAINNFYIKISQKPWIKYEGDTFDYGYYYSVYTTLINSVGAFG